MKYFFVFLFVTGCATDLTPIRIDPISYHNGCDLKCKEQYGPLSESTYEYDKNGRCFCLGGK